MFLCDISAGSELIDLSEFLGDDYDEGGTWFLNNSVVNSELPITENITGDYSYVTYGVNDLCNDTSFINLTVNTLPEAGTEAYALVCSGDPSFSMFSKLNGNPQAGGQWYDPNSNTVNDIFDPLTSEVGTYTYVVEGENVCPTDSENLLNSCKL